MVQLASPGAPTSMGRYEIVATLASGGMAEILLARLEGAEGFQRPVVVKRILPQLARTRSYRDMFVDEARIVAGIRHPNVVQVHELGQQDDELFLVMEYLDGESLGSLMRRLWSRGRRMDRDLAAWVVAEACAGLHAAHELADEDGAPRGLVHRDVSPHNVFLGYQGGVKVLDFGIAQASERITKTETGQVKGKFEYMAPEQIQSRPLDRRADVFALGVLLYELTTARRLFKRPSLPRVIDAICREPLALPAQVDPGYPAALEAVCTRALARRPAERWATALEMRRALLAAMEGEGRPRLPEERLAALMHELFEDRLAAKREMLRRCASGSKVTSVPEAEVDAEVEIPVAFDDTRVEGTLPGSTTDTSAAPRRNGASLVAGLGAVAAVVVLVAVLANARPAIDPARSGFAEAAAALPALPAATGSASAAAPAAASEVTLEVVSNPPDAEVRLDGVPRGTTPVTVRLPRGAAALRLELRRDGFAPVSQSVSPDVDQRLVLQLEPRAARPAPQPARRGVKGAKSRDPNGGHEVFE